MYDPLLGVQMARRLHTLLTDAGLVGELHEFVGHHEIPPGALRGAQGLIERVFSA